MGWPQSSRAITTWSLVILLFALGITWLYCTYGARPILTNQVPLDASLAERLQQLQREGRVIGDPINVTLAYLFDGTQESVPKGLEVEVHYRSQWQVEVEVLNHAVPDDGVRVRFDRLTLIEQGGWLPINHESAWQGQGRLGWTDAPPL